MRKLIVVGLALAAMASFGAFGASFASAAPGDFDFACGITGGNQTTACFTHGVQKSAKQTFRVNGGTVLCSNVTVIGGSTAAEGGTKVITEVGGLEDWAIHVAKVVPTYTNCTFNGLAATVASNGCSFTLTPTSKTAGKLVGIDCVSPNTIVITVSGAGGCTITVPAQTSIPFNTVDFASEEAEGKKDVLVTATVGTEIPVKGAVSGIKYTSTGGTCGESGENGSYRGSVTVKAYKSEKIEAANQINGTIVETTATGKIQ